MEKYRRQRWTKLYSYIYIYGLVLRTASVHKWFGQYPTAICHQTDIRFYCCVEKKKKYSKKRAAHERAHSHTDKLYLVALKLKLYLKCAHIFLSKFIKSVMWTTTKVNNVVRPCRCFCFYLWKCRRSQRDSDGSSSSSSSTSTNLDKMQSLFVASLLYPLSLSLSHTQKDNALDLQKMRTGHSCNFIFILHDFMSSMYYNNLLVCISLAHLSLSVATRLLFCRFVHVQITFVAIWFYWKFKVKCFADTEKSIRFPIS